MSSFDNKYKNMSMQERAAAKRKEKAAPSPAKQKANNRRTVPQSTNVETGTQAMTVIGPPYDPINNPAAERGSPFTRGLRLSEEILGEEGLRTEEMKDVMKKRKQQAEEGIGQEEQLAMKTKLARQMMQAEQTAGLKLGSALGGMTGAATGAQVRSLQAQGLQARAGIERDIFMAQEAAKREGLDKLEATTQFDVGQIGKEKELQATLGLGLERVAATRAAGLLAAQAAQAAGGGGKK